MWFVGLRLLSPRIAENKAILGFWNLLCLFSRVSPYHYFSQKFKILMIFPNLVIHKDILIVYLVPALLENGKKTFFFFNPFSKISKKKISKISKKKKSKNEKKKKSKNEKFCQISIFFTSAHSNMQSIRGTYINTCLAFSEFICIKSIKLIAVNFYPGCSKLQKSKLGDNLKDLLKFRFTEENPESSRSQSCYGADEAWHSPKSEKKYIRYIFFEDSFFRCRNFFNFFCQKFLWILDFTP